MSLVERWKAALEENQNNWKKKIVKEKPVCELSVKESRKPQKFHKLEFEQNINKYKKLDNENYKNIKYNCSSKIIINEKKLNNNILISDISDEYLSKSKKNVLLEKKFLNNNQLESAFQTNESPKELFNEFKTDKKEMKINLLHQTKKKPIEFSSKKVLSDELLKNGSSIIQNNTKTISNKIETEEKTNQLLTNLKRTSLSHSITNKRLPSRLCKNTTEKVTIKNTINQMNKNDKDLSAESILKNNIDLGIEFSTPKTERKIFTSDESLNQICNKSALNISFNCSNNKFQTPTIGLQNCGVKLRQVNDKRNFPDVMLIQFRGPSVLNIRLVNPKLFSIDTKNNFGSYLLVTQDRLIILNSDNSSIFEKSKASQMAYDVLAGKELSCYASKVEIANNDSHVMAEFKRLTCINENKNIPSTSNMNHSYTETLLNFSLDMVYCVDDNGNIQEISKGQPPSLKHFDCSKILIFDFISEIHILIGQSANRLFISNAVKFAESLKNTPFNLMQKAMFNLCDDKTDNDNLHKRPEWTILRKQTQGIVDCLFRYKFDDFFEQIIQLNEFSTPKKQEINKISGNKRLWSVSAAYNQVSNLTLSNQISALCSDNAYFGILKDEDLLINDLSVSLGLRSELLCQNFRIDGVELNLEDKNIFTEKLIFYRLADEENLECLGESLLEFNDQSCYVIEWHYRIERQGISKLNGEKVLSHDTGRERIVYFYWLGKQSTIKDQSRCALALRNFDKNRQEHFRIESGHEPLILLNLLEGKMIISGTNSNWFLVTGSTEKLFCAEELLKPVEFRMKGAYLQFIVNKYEKNKVICWIPFDCKDTLKNSALVLGAQLATSRNAEFISTPKQLNCEILNSFIDIDNNLNKKFLSLSIKSNAPRIFRIYGNEGEELLFERFHKEINFTFRQTDLKDCVLIDQGNYLWIWSENVVRTFELKVAYKIWYEIRGNLKDKDNAKVITKGNEPIEFKALFPTWNDKLTNNNNNKENTEEDDNDELSKQPQSLIELLHERTRFRSLNELLERKLPKGCDTKNLERYLNDNDFKQIFNCTKDEYDRLPRWKQISLKKAANLF